MATLPKGRLEITNLSSPSFEKKHNTLRWENGIDSLSRSYNIQWDGVTVYGRADAIQTYKATGDTFNLSWPVIFSQTDSVTSSKRLRKIQAFARWWSRPRWEDGFITEAPLFAVQYPVPSETPWIRVIAAPTSISLDFGDRARLISSIETDKASAIDVFSEVQNNAFPERILVTLSGIVVENLEGLKTGTKGIGRHSGDLSTIISAAMENALK